MNLSGIGFDGKKYQMVRGRTPDNKVVMGVLCFDELNESGENVIHSVEAFERNGGFCGKIFVRHR